MQLIYNLHLSAGVIEQTDPNSFSEHVLSSIARWVLKSLHMESYTVDFHTPKEACAFLYLCSQTALCTSRPNLTILTPSVHNSISTNFLLSPPHPQPPFYCRDVAEMYDNILHKPLSLRPGVSLTAWSILEELLEKDRQNRLGAKEDFVCTSFPVSSLLSLFII